MASSDLINVAADANQEILDRIKKAEGDEAELLKQVFDSFDSLRKLISQVIETFKSSKDGEKETNVTDMIMDRIKKAIVEKIKSKVEAKKKKEEEFQRAIEEAQRNLSEKRKDLDDQSKPKLRVWPSFFGLFESNEESVENARQTLEEAEKRLKKIKEEAEDSDKRLNEEIQRWQAIPIDELEESLQLTLESTRKKSFPQPKRFKIPQPFLGKDPNHPEIEVVEYVEKVKPIQEPQQVSNYVTSPISSKELHLDIPQHSIKIEVIAADQISGGEEPQQKSFPQPKRFKIPQPVLGKDPNHPEIEVVDYVEKGKSILEPQQVSNYVTSPISSKELHLDIPQHSIKIEVIAAEQISGGEEPQQTPSIKASPVPESEQNNASPVHTPDQSVFNHPCPAQSPDQVTEIKPSPLYTSYRETSPPMQPCIAGPSGAKILSGEEMNRTVTSTTSLFTGGGSPMDEKYKRSQLALMKQACTSELNQSKKTQEIDSDASFDDSLTMPQLFKSPNSVDETDKSRPSPDLHFEDSFDEELDSLAKKTCFVSCNSETDFGLDTPALTPLNPLTDELEAAMAKRHGESLNEEPEEDKMPPSSMTKIVKEQSTASRVGEINEASFEAKSKPKSTPIPRALSRHSREMKELFKDQTVQNMLRDIEERGLNKRPISAINYKELHSNGSDKEVRAPRRGKRAKKDDSSIDYELTPPRKKKMSRTTSTPVVDSSPQDQALQQWEPILNSTNEDKVVYVPRKLANPADSSVIVGRQTISSDPSADGIQNNNPKTPHSLEGAQRSPLSDHSYAAVESSHELGSADDLVSKLSAKCQEIQISCRDQLLCIKLCPRTSILRNSLNSNILKELSLLLRKLKMETSIHVVLITSSGPDFCNGIDFPSLIHENMAQRLESAMTIVSNLQEFITELANCDKLLIGGLVGSVMGLGVAMLPYLDAVYACDKTSFCLPYVKLGQSYEGGLSLTLPLVSRNLVKLLFCEGRRLTATQAKDYGLIQDVCLPDNFEKEVVLRACKIAAEFTQSSLDGKRMSQSSLRRDLPDVLKKESQLLRRTWISDDFQRRAKQLYANGDLLSSL
ncbi:uncharacterized protein LOC124190745 isoform X2 [Daphnia pulex]|uniref:uncharacterized protein LOC124190745 isoform X2 n=1 Tax=Daphnia pulex TaxID=6669 RepID=UPI001EDF894A|nr:uncharacterized protein LOC124190745 isoform X2 [Daphnia pulex]